MPDEMTQQASSDVEESTRMITLTEAFADRFPTGSSWARQALASIGVDFTPDVLVHDMAAGWIRHGDESAPLIDTLWVLTADQLGIGQTNAGSGTPRWIPLAAVVAMDAIDESPLPLQTVELTLAGGLVMTVGWPDRFTDRVVAVLTAMLSGTPVPPDDRSEGSMPRELSDPAVSAGVLDPSSLDELAPSEWVDPGADPAQGQVLGSIWSDESELPASPFGAEPLGEEPLGGAEGGVSFEPRGTADDWVNPFDIMDTSVANAPFSPLDHAEEPVATSDFSVDPVGTVAETPGFDVRPELPVLRSDDPGAPWNRAGVTWPPPVAGVTYVGGHGSQPRKRKNGTLSFSPRGIEASGSGLQSWSLHIEWLEVTAMRIEGTDEVMFTEGVRIDASSSALIVELVDGTKTFFEVRLRRPGSLRSPLAPLLLLVDNIKGYRATGGR